MLQKSKSITALLCIITLLGSLLTACGSTTEGTKAASSEPSQSAVSDKAEGKTSTTSADTRTYTDYVGHKVEIPASPTRVVFHGESIGDLLALGIMPAAAAASFTEGTIFADQVSGLPDVGFPINLEKVLELEPDLILIGTTDEKIYEQLSKVAPTLVIDTFAPLDERMRIIGDLFGKKDEAEQWLTSYHAKEQEMWEQLKKSEMKPGETASVLTYYPGNRLFVMAVTGFSQILYNENGFKPTPRIQEVLDAGKGFEEISMELLPEVAGDRIFILTPVDEEAVHSTNEMMNSKLWSDLPAVKNGKVYQLPIRKSESDATSRENILAELPVMLSKK
ncbi:ABC transporter substrate-binding protein [Paenibacillus sp. 1001270B_150601_E10]|uniref:ABC transporter substrate-binding protein n=1 Tax=Paenibacillus sp. 1001270B_150601_E10 TaxID=2787079 RepID=UPI00189D3EFF|nr:ABC transporter substrate-binding protein [Paenibacillus sp. 1001270B_150601_E10]